MAIEYDNMVFEEQPSREEKGVFVIITRGDYWANEFLPDRGSKRGDECLSEQEWVRVMDALEMAMGRADRHRLATTKHSC